MSQIHPSYFNSLQENNTGVNLGPQVKGSLRRLRTGGQGESYGRFPNLSKYTKLFSANRVLIILPHILQCKLKGKFKPQTFNFHAENAYLAFIQYFINVNAIQA